MKTSLATAIFIAGLSTALPAAAATVSCPGTVSTTDREFTLTTTLAATCLATGTGNINGNNDAINQLGYVTLDKSDDNNTYAGTANELLITGSGTTSGTFSFVAPVGFQNFVIAFKSGQVQLDPDWAAFLLSAGTTSGSWSISGNQSLSHANLYAQACPQGVCQPNPGPSPVPLPAPFLLFGAALGGLAGFRWLKNRKTNAAG